MLLSRSSLLGQFAPAHSKGETAQACMRTCVLEQQQGAALLVGAWAWGADSCHRRTMTTLYLARVLASDGDQALALDPQIGVWGGAWSGQKLRRNGRYKYGPTFKRQNPQRLGNAEDGDADNTTTVSKCHTKAGLQVTERCDGCAATRVRCGCVCNATLLLLC